MNMVTTTRPPTDPYIGSIISVFAIIAAMPSSTITIHPIVPLESFICEYSSMMHISYYSWTENDLNYAWRLNNKWNIETVESYGSVGAYNSIDIDEEGYPHISYMDRSNLS